VLAGTVADRIGRKQVFTITVLLYSISTGLCAVAWNYESLLVFRFLVGFGLGGELPVAATLMSEYAPARLRGRFVVLLKSFWGVGWLVAACISYLFIPTFGWKLAFLLGALPALYVFLLRLHMPESIRYLLSKGRVDEAKAIIRDIERQLKMPERPFLDQLAPGRVEAERVETPGFASLWAKGMRRRTTMLWLAWFGIVFSYYGIFMWLPSIVYAQGFEIVKTFEYVLIMTLVGVFLTTMVMAREWERGTLEALFITPVRPIEILLSKMIPYFGIATIGFWLCMAAARYLYGVPVHGSFLMILLGSVIYLIVTLGMGLTISSVIKNQFFACQVSMLVSTLPTVMLSGFIFDLRSAPAVVYAVGHVLPATYYMELLKSLFLAGNDWALIRENCLILGGYAVFFTGLSCVVTKKRLE